MEIVFIVVPVLLLLSVTYLYLDRFFFNKKISKENFFATRRNTSEISLLRLRAYERLSLFLERIKPNDLVISNLSQEQTCLDLQKKLLGIIRQEYAHNVSQQIYVSDELWLSIVFAKESIVKLINTCMMHCDLAQPASVLAELIVQSYASSEDTPCELAFNKLKEEVRTVF